MSFAAKRIKRLQVIDRAIRDGMRSGKAPNATCLAGKCGVSAKTVYRDIEILDAEMKAPVLYDEREGGYIYTELNWKFPLVTISESDIFAIAIAEKTLQIYENTPLYGKLKAVFDKIESSLPEDIIVKPDELDMRFSVRLEPSTRIDPAIWEKTFEALRDGKTLQADYQLPSQDRPLTREIDPYHAMNYRGEWYVIGRCHYNKDIRTFAISRIKRARVMSNSNFAIPKDFSIERYMKNQFGIMTGEKNCNVKIKFTKQQAPYIEERDWHPTQKMKKHSDGSLTLSFTTRSLFEVKRWVLSYGASAKVLAPKELADMIRKELDDALS